ncbi:hypothetical protein CIG19_16915 [Enterobacterales bacterium CwR94]|nr:hypothetical protein CIG19_16915 [Enterobacterales bacterium CwR94]
MKTTPVFDEIVATCALVAMRGVIPSLLEYQTQLRARVERFGQELADKKLSAETRDALCRLTCKVLDINTQQCLEEQDVSWRGYELEHVFYGYSQEPLYTEAHATQLFTDKSEDVVHYALLLSSLSPVLLPGSEYRQSLTLAKPAVTVVSKRAERIEPVPVTEVEPEPAPPHFWTPLLIQLFATTLLLAGLWSACWHYLKDGM